MNAGHTWHRWLSRLCAAAGVTVAAATPVTAQGNYCPPAPCPAPTYTPPGLMPPATGAPSTSTTAPEATPRVDVAPESSALALSGSSAAMSFTPFMMGDLAASSYVCGLVCFPVQRVVTIPPVTRVITPSNPSQPSPGLPAPNQPSQVIVTPGSTQVVTSQACRYILVPQVGRGAVKIEENESPRPMDRAYVTYNYFNDIARAFPGLPGTDLHRETYGFETTFLGGDASVGVRLNTLQTTGGSTLNGSDFGDVTVIAKYALVNNAATGNVASVGLAVSAPTGPDAVLPDGSRLNPVLLQPFAGGIVNWDRVYVQSFSSLIVPTDGRDVLLATASVGAGWWAYRSADGSGPVSYVAPFTEGHGTFALNHRGLDTSVVESCGPGAPLAGFPDTVVLTNGVHLGLGRRSNLAIGVGVPVTGPKIFDVEALAQLNWRF